MLSILFVYRNHGRLRFILHVNKNAKGCRRNTIENIVHALNLLFLWNDFCALPRKNKKPMMFFPNLILLFGLLGIGLHEVFLVKWSGHGFKKFMRTNILCFWLIFLFDFDIIIFLRKKLALLFTSVFFPELSWSHNLSHEFCELTWVDSSLITQSYWSVTLSQVNLGWFLAPFHIFFPFQRFSFHRDLFF